MLIFFIGLSPDEEDFLNELFKTQHKKFFNISLCIVHSKEQAEEAVQETFLRIHKHIEKIYQLPGPQRVPYCVVMVKNISYNLIRSERKMVYCENLDYILKKETVNPESELMKAEEVELLFKLLDTLSANDKALMQMKYGKDMNYRDIGTVLGITEQAAMKRGQRILKKLRKAAEKEGQKYEVF